jgi:NAD(P)-dependent dehydrogenase (short-subunit alcohol dehydrogenase family)
VLASTERTPDVALDAWEQAFAVNARGTFLTCKHALPRMRPGAAIVNIASVAGMVGREIVSDAAVVEEPLLATSRR